MRQSVYMDIIAPLIFKRQNELGEKKEPLSRVNILLNKWNHFSRGYNAHKMLKTILSKRAL